MGATLRYRTRLVVTTSIGPIGPNRPKHVIRTYPEARTRFQVQARDGDGRTGGIAAFGFRIVPPLYRSATAYALYCLLGLGVIAAFVQWRVGRAERARRQLESVVATRTEDNSPKHEIRQNLPIEQKACS